MLAPRTRPDDVPSGKPDPRDWLILAGLAAAALLAVEGIPGLFRLDNPTAPRTPELPPSAALLAVGLSVSLCTAGALYVVLRRRPGFPPLALGLAVAYNVLIVLLKFTLGPAALWQGQYESYFGTFGVALSRSISVAILYLLAFAIVGGITWFWVIRRIERGTLPQAKLLGAHTPGVVLMAGCLIFASSLIFVSWALAPSLTADLYLQILFSGTIGTLAAVLLAATMTSGILAFVLAGRRAIDIRDAGFVVTLFWVGLALLVIYHILWVLYIVTLAAIWPLRTYVPK